MIKIGLLLAFAIVLLFAETQSDLVEEMYQTSNPEQRAKLMNEVKKKLAQLNETERENKLKSLRLQFENKHENSQSDMESTHQDQSRSSNDNPGNHESENDNNDNNGGNDSGGDNGGNDD